MIPSEPKSDAEAWSNLWQHGERGAIDLDANDPVAEALRRHWDDQSAWLAQCGTVLDVGSGPAVLPRLMVRRHPKLLEPVNWICQDQAKVPPLPGSTGSSRFQLRAGEDFASSPPLPSGVDAVISNFGVEYVRRPAVASALFRWIRPGGRFHAVVHAGGSLIDQLARLHEADIALALESARLFEHADALLRAMASLPADPLERMMHGVEARDAYNGAINQLKSHMEQRGARSAPLVDMMQSVQHLAGVVRSQGLEPALQALSQRHTDYKAESLRLKAMQGAALDEAGVQGFVRMLDDAGLRGLRTSSLVAGPGLVGWVVVAERP
ncbi:MAG: class I SAM-dependent methyltransferase [Rubrivivax sp.]